VSSCIETFMRELHRALVYLLATALIEGPSFIVLYSSGFPNSATLSGTGGLALLISYNLFLYFIYTNAIGGPEAAAPQGTLIYNQLFQLVAGIVGMLIILTVIGEMIVWLRREIEKH
jgi:hypothetical protein